MALIPFLGIKPVVSSTAYVQDSAQVIGDVELGDESTIWFNAVVRGDVNHIRIGRGSNIQDLTMCHVSHKNAAKPEGSPLIIGDYVTVGHSVVLHGCRIGNEVLVGMGSIIMDDAVVEDRVIIGAGSLVPPGKVLESGTLYVGRPVKAVRKLDADEIAGLRYSANLYIKARRDYMKQGA